MKELGYKKSLAGIKEKIFYHTPPPPVVIQEKH